jgi:hypothetical protein
MKFVKKLYWHWQAKMAYKRYHRQCKLYNKGMISIIDLQPALRRMKKYEAMVWRLSNKGK